MKSSKIIMLSVAVLLAASCQKEIVPTPTVQQPVAVEQNLEIPTPEGFSEWPRTVFVFDKNNCIRKFDVADESEMKMKLDVGSGYQVVALAYDDKDKLYIQPSQEGEPAYRYKVAAAGSSSALPRLWYSAVSYDKEADTLKLSFQPITSTLNIDFEGVPSDLDSITIDLPVSMDCWYPCQQKTEVSTPGSKPKHISLSNEELQEKISMGVFAMLNYNSTDSSVLRCQVPVCYYYKDYRKPGVLPFKGRIGDAQICDVSITPSGEDFYDNEFNVECTRRDMVGGEEITVKQPLSLWPIRKDVQVASDTTNFPMNAGRSFAYIFGSISSGWYDGHTSFGISERTIKELSQYKSYGFDFYRIPIDEGYCFFSDGTAKPEFKTALKKLVDEAIKAEVRVILDLHWLALSQTFPYSQQEIQYRSCWKQLHEMFKDYDPEWVAYEILNEPNAWGDYWNTFVENTVYMIRSWGGNEVNRKIICTCAPGQNISGMSTLELPEDPNLIASFHDYSPTFFGFYCTGWSPEIGYDKYYGPCHYPGRQVTDDEMEYMKVYQPSNYTCAATYWAYEEWNYGVLYEHFYPAYEAKKRLNVPVWVGEYGAYSGEVVNNRVVYCRAESQPSTPSGGSYYSAPAGWSLSVPAEPAEQTVWMSECGFVLRKSGMALTGWTTPTEWDGETASYESYWHTEYSERLNFYKDVCKLFRNFGFSHSYWFALTKNYELDYGYDAEHDLLIPDMPIVNAVVGKEESE